MTSEVLPVHKHYLIIDSPIPFYLIANDGTDKVYRMAGAWQLDLWTLLTKKENPQNPVYKLELQYDETLLQSGQVITYSMSDINLGTGVSGVNGQSVVITENRTDPATETTLKYLKNDIYNLNNYIHTNSICKFTDIIDEVDRYYCFSILGALTIPQKDGSMKVFNGHFILYLKKINAGSSIAFYIVSLFVLGGGKYDFNDFGISSNILKSDLDYFFFNGLYNYTKY